MCFVNLIEIGMDFQDSVEVMSSIGIMEEVIPENPGDSDSGVNADVVEKDEKNGKWNSGWVEATAVCLSNKQVLNREQNEWMALLPDVVRPLSSYLVSLLVPGYVGKHLYEVWSI